MGTACQTATMTIDHAQGPPKIGTAHRRRLREVWRSAGWPFQDLVEVELLAAGLILRVQDRKSVV